MIATDATATVALEAQLRQLSAVLERLSWVRRQLVPAKATFWDGEARRLYDHAVLALGSDIDSVLEIVSYAQQSTMLALAEELRGA
ncbi:MAG: hypothetical protein JWR04_2915 [Rhodoglobus sp.]|jgi:hypothetical protein|nr:hypothetical protein [Rhodoglobus sp.]